MDEERIDEILKDPNTWDWDGCTYPDFDIKEDWEDAWMADRLKFVEELKKRDRKLT